MDFYVLSAQPDKTVAVIVIIIAFGVGLAAGLFTYFKVIRNKNENEK